MAEYKANYKQWDHQGNLVPEVEYSDSVRPHGEFLVAPWIPLALAGGVYDKAIEEYFSIMAGKAVAFSRDGYVVPAGLKVHFELSGSLKYTQLDLEQGVWDLVTNKPVDATSVAQHGGSGYTVVEVKAALVARNLLDSTENATDFISYPVGVAPYSYYNAFSRGSANNPTAYRKHNFNPQPRVAILCDYVLELPMVPGLHTTGTITSLFGFHDNTTNKANSYYWQSVSAGNIATPTDRTPYTFASDTHHLFVNKKTSLRAVRNVGDYFVDSIADRIYFQHTGGATNAQNESANVTVSLYTYSTESNSQYSSISGDIKPGDYLIVDHNSNYVVIDDISTLANLAVGASYNQNEVAAIKIAAAQLLDQNRYVIGQVLEIEQHPKSARELVRTAGQNLPANQFLDKLPGTATKGLPDKLTYAGGSDLVARVNIINK